MVLGKKLVDYHVHSDHSCDGKSTIFEMCQKAIELEIQEIGFSEHVDFEPKDWGFGFFNYERYTSDIKSAREFFKKRLVIRKGIELDYQHCFEDYIKDWLQNKKFDFVVGSVHYLDHEIISRRLMTEKSRVEVYHAYLDEVTYSIDSGLFDVIGHLDLPTKYIDDRCFEFKDSDYEKGMKAVLEEVMERKMYLEINSSLSILKESCTDTLPSREVFTEYIGNGGKLISIGSDAHSVEEIGKGINEILDFLANYGNDKLRLLFE